MIIQREAEYGTTPLTNSHKADYVDYTFPDEDDVELADHVIDFEDEVDETHSPDDLIESEAEPTQNSAPKKLPSKPVIPQYNAVTQQMHCDTSTLVYMSHINTIFNHMILNREETFTSENLGHCTKFLKRP